MTIPSNRSISNHEITVCFPASHPSVSTCSLVFLQPNKKNTSCQNSEVDFPCSIVMGPKTVGSARWNSWELGISNWAPGINVSQMFLAWIIHTHTGQIWLQLVGKCINMAYMNASGTSYDFPKSTCLVSISWGCSPYQDASQDEYIGIACMEHLDMVYAPTLNPYKSIQFRQEYRFHW